MKIKKIIYIAIGCVSLALGVVGVILPVLPTTPFLLVTAFCFARSSDRLNHWFKGTKLYKKHLESFVKKQGMKISTKVCILTSATLLMGFGFFMMARKSLWIPCSILGTVWVAHVIYFVFFVKTVKKPKAGAAEKPKEIASEGQEGSQEVDKP